MQIPAWVKPAVYGVILGSVGVMIVGFSFGGWVTGGTARQMVSTGSAEAVVTALTPVCVDISKRDPKLTERLAEIKAASAYRRADFVSNNGWATPPGSGGPNRQLANACAEQLTAS